MVKINIAKKGYFHIWYREEALLSVVSCRFLLDMHNESHHEETSDKPIRRNILEKEEEEEKKKKLACIY